MVNQEELIERLIEGFKKEICSSCSLKEGFCFGSKSEIGKCMCKLIISSWELREGLLDALKSTFEKVAPAPKIPISN